MRRLMKTLLAVPPAMLVAMLVAGVSTADTAPETSAPAAEVACTSFTNVSVSETGRYWVHVPSTSSGSGNTNCVLARGHNNIGVKALQESLNACFKQGLVPDSDFGGLTEQAVKNAQIAINQQAGFPRLDVDGRFGPRTSGAFRFQIYDHWNGGAHTGQCL